MSKYYFFPKVRTPANAVRYLKMEGWLEKTIGLMLRQRDEGSTTL